MGTDESPYNDEKSSRQAHACFGKVGIEGYFEELATLLSNFTIVRVDFRTESLLAGMRCCLI